MQSSSDAVVVFVVVTRIKNDMGVSIRIPPDNEKSNIIRIEGNPEGVALAKKELLDMVTKMVRHFIAIVSDQVRPLYSWRNR